MKTVTKKEQIKINLEKLEQYLLTGSEDEKVQVLKLIGNGRCFIAYKIRKAWHFAPSRFAGYVGNTLGKHLINDQKDGRVTNPAIEKALKGRFTDNPELEGGYIDYCGKIGAKASGYRKRRYILLNPDK